MKNNQFEVIDITTSLDELYKNNQTEEKISVVSQPCAAYHEEK